MKGVSIRTQEYVECLNTIKWLNSKTIKRSFGLTKEITLEAHIEWLRENPNIEVLSIFHHSLHVGNIILDFNESHDSVFFQIYIGDPNSHGKGIGTAAMDLALNYIFVEKQKNRVHLKVFEDNIPAICLYEKLGFVKEGIERESHKMDGFFRNQLLYSMLCREWKVEV